MKKKHGAEGSRHCVSLHTERVVTTTTVRACALRCAALRSSSEMLVHERELDRLIRQVKRELRPLSEGMVDFTKKERTKRLRARVRKECWAATTLQASRNSSSSDSVAHTEDLVSFTTTSKRRTAILPGRDVRIWSLSQRRVNGERPSSRAAT